MSNLYTNSTLSSRKWSKDPNFIDMSIGSLKELIKDTSNVSQVLTVSFTKEIQPLYAPTFADADEEDETDFYLIGNASNVIPSESPVKTLASSCGYFVSLAFKNEVGELSEGHAPLPNHLLRDSDYANEEVILLLIPSVCPIPYSITVPTGSIKDRFVAKSLEKMTEQKIWLDMVQSSQRNKTLIDSIMNGLSSAELAKHLPGFNEADLNPNGPFTILAPVCLSTVEENTHLHEMLLKVASSFKVASPSGSPNTRDSGRSSDSPDINAMNGNQAAQTQPGASTFSPETFLEFAKIMAHPDHDVKKKEDELAMSIIKNLHISAKIDWTTGKIDSELSQPTLSPNFLECFKYKSTVRVQMLKNYLESGMDAPDDDDIYAAVTTIDQDRCLKHYNQSALLQYVKGNIEKESIECLHSEGSTFDILVLASQRDSGSKISLLRKSEVARKMEEELDVPDSQRSKVQTATVRIGSVSNLDDIRTLGANLVGHHNLIAVMESSTHRGHVVVPTAIYYKLYVLISSSKHKEWEVKFQHKQPQYYVIVFKTFERIFRLMSCFAQNNKNVSYNKADDMTRLSRDVRIQQAVTVAHKFITEVKEKIAMEDYFTVIPDITPDDANPEKIKEKKRASDSAALAAKASANSKTQADDSAAGGAGSEKPGKATPAKRKANQLVSASTPNVDPKTKGFFVPSKDCTRDTMFKCLEGKNLGKNPCFDHHAIGHECSFGRGCKFLHGSAIRMKSEMLTAIFDNMLEHKKAHFNKALKNGKFGELVVEKYQSLWEPSSNDAPPSGA